MKDTDLNEYEQTRAIYAKYFTLGYIDASMESKLALIAMICYVTDSINKKREALNKVSCYQVICKIGKDLPDETHYNFFKGLGVICEDFMYGCTDFPTFGMDPKAMPKEILRMLKAWMPF